MKTADLKAVAVLARQLGYPCQDSEIEGRFKRLAGHDDYHLLVAESDGAILGYIQINREPITLLADARADIAALVVDENSRGQGIGAALVSKAEDWAVAQKLKLLRVRSNLKRENAHRFYVRQGYQLQKTSNIFEKALSSY